MSLAQLAHELAVEWNVELGPVYPHARHSYVAPAGDEAVIKLVPRDDDESKEAALALELWAGEGAVRLLRHDTARRALLLERLRPGTDLGKLPDERSTEIAVEVGLQLWRPAGTPFRWIGDHVPRWLDEAELVAGTGFGLIPLARELYASLEIGCSTLVHGDFHHHNVLSTGGRYVAIDPKPMLGEPEYDVPSFLWNPLSYRMERDVTTRRLSAFAAAGLDEKRMRAWAVIRGAYLRTDENEIEILRALV